MYLKTLLKEIKKYRIKNLLKDVDAMVEDATLDNFKYRGKICIFPQLVNKKT